MESRTVRELKKGEFFTLKPIEDPNWNQVFVRAGYDRSEKKYDVFCYGDVSRTRMLKSSTVVWTGFTF